MTSFSKWLMGAVALIASVFAVSAPAQAYGGGVTVSFGDPYSGAYVAIPIGHHRHHYRHNRHYYDPYAHHRSYGHRHHWRHKQYYHQPRHYRHHYRPYRHHYRHHRNHHSRHHYRHHRNWH
jgi:hypothetical protein